MGDETDRDFTARRRDLAGLRNPKADPRPAELVPPAPMDFDGPAYLAPVDRVRLTGQLMRIFEVMRSGNWRTLEEVEALTGYGQASISAQLRHLRKPRFGEHSVEKRRRGEESAGLWEYRLIVNRRGL